MGTGHNPDGDRSPGPGPSAGASEAESPRPGEVSDPLDALLRDLAEAPIEDPSARRGPAPGDRIGRYQLLRELGRGGFGVVYEARDVELGRHVAVKALRADRLRRGSEEQRALRLSLIQKEAATVARLQHPNIVTLHDLVVQDGLPYLVLELLSGETLQARLRQGPLGLDEALDAAVQVARGLAHAHGAGVIHRDLKPSNVFRARDGLVKLLDLGLARGLAGSDLLPRAGTPGFMAPEQWRGEGDERTDVFGLGMLLHALLGGRVPQIASATFASGTGTSGSAGAGQGPPRAEGAPPLEPVEPPAAAPPPLAALIARACALDPAQRPPSAQALLDELLALQRARRDGPSSPSPLPPGVASAPSPLPSPATPLVRPLPRRSVRIAALAAMLIGAALIPWLASGRRKATLGAPPLPRDGARPQAAGAPPAPPPDSLLPTGALATPRAGAVAQLLRNGLVLVAGGAGEEGPLASAELFDPQADGGLGAWRPLQPLREARAGGVALLLGDGRVLIASGEGKAGALSSTELFDPAAGSFAPGPPLHEARAGAAAVLLGDGRALLAGGDRDGAPLASCELFDPSEGPAGAFVPAAPLRAARTHAAAALLPGGAVLIAGGLGPAGALDSAELFLAPPRGSGQPGAVLAAGRLAAARAFATALPLADGAVLIAGGLQGGRALASVELFDPDAAAAGGARGAFRPLGPLATARHSAAALLLPGGELLFAGGKGDNDSRLASAEVYDPLGRGAGEGAPRGVSRPLANLSTPRGDAVAVLLPNGRALIAGGDRSPRRALSSAELYLPRGAGRTGRAVRTGSLVTARASASAALLPSGRVAIAGGRGGAALDALELFDPRADGGAGSFSAAGRLLRARTLAAAAPLADGRVLLAGGLDDAGAPLASTELLAEQGSRLAASAGPPLAAARAQAAALRLADGRVLVAGGAGESGAPLASAELYDPQAPGARAGAFSTTGPLGAARAAPMAALLADGRVLLAGGVGESGAPLATAEIYDPRAGSFRPTGAMATARGGSALLRLPSGRVLVAGGHGQSALASAELFDPLADGGRGAFLPTGGLATARNHAAAALLPNGRALLVGGVDEGGAPLASAELYDPAGDDGVGGFEATAGLAVGRESFTATPLPGGGVLIAGGRNNGVLAAAEIWKLE